MMNVDEFQVQLVGIDIMLIDEHMMQHNHLIIDNQYRSMVLSSSLKNFLVEENKNEIFYHFDLNVNKSCSYSLTMKIYFYIRLFRKFV